MNLAPIVLFVYNRPRHTGQTLNALAKNDLADQSVLFIYADGPKNDASTETLENIKKTRNIIKQKKWCKEVFIIESDTNKGLANSIISGVTEVVNKYGKIIVLEDDIVSSPAFLRYMNDALNVYEDNQKVISVGALNFFATDNKVNETFFVPIPDCWGWATWKNRWQLFEPNAQLLLNRLREKGLINKFNLNGVFNFESMLIDQIKGNISSWAIRWQAVAYLEDKLTLYPKYSVTKNIGFGMGGTHGGVDRFSKHIKFAVEKINVEKIPVEEDPYVTQKMIKGYWRTTQPSPLIKTKLKTRTYIKYLLPPIVNKIYRKIKPHRNNSILWQGNFKDWNEAKKISTGYENPLILEKTKNAILKVKNEEAASERDSVLFEHEQYSWPIITYLLKLAIENNNQLNIIDFGGSLGSSYFQNRNMIPDAVKLSWNIVEQSQYVEIGNKEITDNKLHFFYSISEAHKKTGADILLLSSVLQYLEKPYEFLDEIMSYSFKYIIIDRTAFIDDAADRITVQTVPESIYKATYPAWFFNENNFLNSFKRTYNIVTEFDSQVDYSTLAEDGTRLYWKGFLLKINA